MILDFMRKTIVYASPTVIKAFRHWRTNLPNDNASRAEERANFIRYEKLIRAMRKDVGISNWTLEEGDLLRAVLSDFDEKYGLSSNDVTALQAVGSDQVIETQDRAA